MQQSVFSVPEAPHLKIIGFEAGPVATNGYIIADIQSHEAIIIDAPYNSADIFEAILQHYSLYASALWLTHSHWDHTADASILQNKGLEVFCHNDDIYRLIDPMEHTLWPLPFTIYPVSPVEKLIENEILHCGEWGFNVIHTPGHTEGSVCFISEKYNCAIVGDTLFADSIGRTDLPGGNTNQLIHSIKSKLLVLSPETVIFPGHGEISTIGHEQRYNQCIQ